MCYYFYMSYKDLKSYQSAVIVYDFTAEFCEKYIDKKSRTHDQMFQAARSGKQNIAEGAGQNNLEGEIYLTKIARGSFQELLEDFEDFLRQRGLKQWGKDEFPARGIRDLSYKPDRSYKTYETYMSNSETAANCAICLIHQVNFLLDRQIKSIEEKFVKEGGYSENLRRKREDEKKRKLKGLLWD